MSAQYVSTCLAAMTYVCAVSVTSFSTGTKFRLVSNFTELHALTLAAHSNALLFGCMKSYVVCPGTK